MKACCIAFSQSEVGFVAAFCQLKLKLVFTRDAPIFTSGYCKSFGGPLLVFLVLIFAVSHDMCTTFGVGFIINHVFPF